MSVIIGGSARREETMDKQKEQIQQLAHIHFTKKSSQAGPELGCKLPGENKIKMHEFIHNNSP